jgi:hypothetical protein
VLIVILGSNVETILFLKGMTKTPLALNLKPNPTTKRPRMNHELWCLDRKLCVPVSIGIGTVSESYPET